jgi:hypothetical protein
LKLLTQEKKVADLIGVCNFFVSSLAAGIIFAA